MSFHRQRLRLDPAAPGMTLARIERLIAYHYAVTHVSAADVAAARNGPGPAPVLFDARGTAEFAVSRLPGARHLPEGEDGMARLAAACGAAGEGLVVVYCAVGLRSARIVAAMPEVGGRLVNLEGGIFRWHLLGLPLEGGASVHPFDSRWGDLLARERAGSRLPGPGA